MIIPKSEIALQFASEQLKHCDKHYYEAVSRIFVSSVSGLIYSLGVDSISITDVIFVQLATGGEVRGGYSFETQLKIASIISESHGIRFRTISKKDYFNNQQDFAHDDYVELRLYLIAKKHNPGIKPKILALNPEHLSVHFPNPLATTKYEIKASLEQIVRNFSPARAWTFTSIDVIKKRGIVFRSTSINRKQLDSSLRNPFDAIVSAFPYLGDKMNLLRQDQELLVLLPLATHFGGGDKYNEKMFMKIREKVKNEPKLVLIKNHPTDPADYNDLGNMHFRNSKVLNFSAVIERNVPLEILILNSSNVIFAGMFSTTMIGCFQKSVFPSLLFLPSNVKYKEFYKYAQSRQYGLIRHVLEEI